MDRPTTRMDADARGSRLNPNEAFVLPSRRPALELCRATLRAGHGTGPILLTGDAGVGKTWFWRRLQAESPPSCRWIGVDLTPANDPSEFYRLIAHELGLIESGANRASRVDLVDFLTERQTDGERLALVIEEAHNLSMPIWEEVRVLANRLDRPGGFASMMLVGQTSLARRFSTRPFAAIEARLASRFHLGPIDVDEARELLIQLRAARQWSTEEIEILHRDGAGNPGRMLRRVATIAGLPAPTNASQQQPSRLDAPMVTARSAIPSSEPLTGPDRPPIEVDENMIEVGWSPDDAPSPGEPEVNSTPSTNNLASTNSGEEAVLDHYAALQAWREWSENQARQSRPSTESIKTDAGSESEDDLEMEEEEEEIEAESPLLSRTDRPKVWAEGEQKFAPFGQLFSRMAQAREPE